MLTRRMLLVVLALMGVTALVATLTPPHRPARGRPAATSTPTGTPAPLTTPDSQPDAGDPQHPDVSAVLSTAPGRRPRTVDAELGDEVVITVQGPAVDSVQLGDLDIQAVEPGSPAQFSLLADTPGSYPIVLVDAGRRIGTLVVR